MVLSLYRNNAFFKKHSSKNIFWADLYHSTYNIWFCLSPHKCVNALRTILSISLSPVIAQHMEHKNHFVKVRLYLIRRWIHSSQPSSENEYGRYIKHLVYIIISRKKLLIAYVKLPTTQLTMSWTLLSDTYAIWIAWGLFLVACIWINWLSPFKMTPLQVSQGGRQRGSLGAQESLGFEHLGSNWFLLHTSHSASKLLNLTVSPFLIIFMSQSCCKGLLVIGKSIKYII